MFKNPSLATLKAALSSSPDHLSYFFQYGLTKFGYVFLKQKNNQVELVLNCNLGMSKKQLGEGHFCRVFEGTLNGTTIAAKYIKVLSDVPDDAADVRGRRERSQQLAQYQKKLLQYIEEIELSLQVPAHANIITTFGFCANPFILLQEKAMTSLQKHIEDVVTQDRSVSLVWLVECVWMICQGMQHLHQQGIVHRDLALRNTLMMADGTVKIGDFGLSKHIQSQQQEHNRDQDHWQGHNNSSTVKAEEYVYEGGTALAVRWTAPEVLLNPTAAYSKEADVWSSGVVMYELFSGADMPYSDKGILEVRKRVCSKGDDALRLAKPREMPSRVRRLQEQCYEAKENRPTFGEMGTELRDIVEETEDKQVSLKERLTQHEEMQDIQMEDNGYELV